MSASLPDPSIQPPGEPSSAQPPAAPAGSPFGSPSDLPLQPANASGADGAWRRVHPLTPLIKSWQVVAVTLAFLAQDVGQRALTSSEGALPLPQGTRRVWLAGGGIVLVALLILVALAVLSWRMTRFRVGADSLELHHGVLFRQHRRAQLDRLQAVDVVQPLLARLFGLARLNVEVAGAGNSKIQIGYLTDHQAHDLRNQLLAGAAGLDYDTPQAPQAPEHSWLEVPIGRLVAAILLSPATAILVLTAVGFVVSAIVFGSLAPVAGILPSVLGIGGVVWARFNHGFGFRVAISPDGLRLRHGLLEQRTQTVPPGRVQAVRVSQPWLWRRFGWWRVQVNIAGYGHATGEESNRNETLLLPVGTQDDAVAVLAFVVPDLGVPEDEHPRVVMDAALVGTGTADGFVTSPRAARWLDPLSWRRNGFRVTGTAMVIRHGVIERHTVVVPHARTQSLDVTQGPLQRRLGLASFALHSTIGPISPVIAHLRVDDAAQVLSEQADRARRARAAAGPERWMRASKPVAAPPIDPDAHTVEGAAQPPRPTDPQSPTGLG